MSQAFAPAVLTAPCKINMSLRITGVREDGYHLLDSLFWPLQEPCDTLTISPKDGEGIRVRVARRDVDPERNTLTKAWSVFTKTTGLAFPLICELAKGVPGGAGLGGGSSDAACLLRFLQRLADGTGHAVEDAALMAMAARVGADVPFFLHTSPARVRGIGDIVEPVAADEVELPGRWLVLVMPDVQVATPWAYSAYDAEQAAGGPVTQLSAKNGETLTGTEKASKQAFPKYSPAGLFVNDLESVVFREHPELAAIKEQLLQLGASASSMSGSGSSVFGLFTQHSTARAAAMSMVWPVQLCHL